MPLARWREELPRRTDTSAIASSQLTPTIEASTSILCSRDEVESSPGRAGHRGSSPKADRDAGPGASYQLDGR